MTTPTSFVRAGQLGLAVALSALGQGSAALAQVPEKVTELEAITLTTVSEPSPEVSFSGSNQTQIGPDLLEREYSGASLSTVLDNIAGVSAEKTAGDPSIAVNIRGLQNDGRVAVTIDGAQQNFARSGHTANSTFYADSEMLRSIEVVRGPVGTKAAAGAIGGTLALRTVEADDLIAEDATQGGEIRLRYGDLSDQPTLHGAWATRLGESSDLLVAATSRENDDYTAPDGTEVLAATSELSLLAKLGHDFAGGQRLSFGLSSLDSDYKTGLLAIPRSNHLETQSGTLNFTGSAGAWHQLDGTLFHTKTHVEQRLMDADGHGIGPERWYQTATTGLSAAAARNFAIGRFDHRTTFVLEGYEDRVTVDDPTATGGSLTTPGNRSLWSLIAEDSVALTANTEAAFGLRYDLYRMDSKDGATDGQQVSPSLTLRHTIGATTFHAILGRAYRPPTLSEALVNGMHPEPADFFILPNPNLNPESATTYELGATIAASDVFSAEDRLDARVAVYRNEVEDYIGLVQHGTLFNSYFQYDNIDHVRLEGVEVELSYDMRQWFGRIIGQTTHGIDVATGGAISGIAPDRLTLTAGWRSNDQGLEIGTRLTATTGREDGVLSSDPWQTVDIFVNRDIGENGTFNLALNNITDENYITYLATQPEPGFNAQASLIWKF